MPTQPEDVVNEALDEIGVDTISDMSDGSKAANVATRVYDPMLRGMHAAAPWNFARKESQMSLLGDAGGQYVPNTKVPTPWSYMYEWPVDCVHVRYIKDLGAYALADDGTPLYAPPAWNRPAPFVVTNIAIPNDVASSWDTIEGHDPESTRVILCNQLGAIIVYTGIIQYPDNWDALFHRAFVAALAARFAVPCMADKKLAFQIRGQQIQIAKEALIEARVRDGNEAWTVVDHTPDWIRARTSGAPVFNSFGCGWQAMPFVEDGGGAY